VQWIPAFAGMTGEEAGMRGEEAGMTVMSGAIGQELRSTRLYAAEAIDEIL